MATCCIPGCDNELAPHGRLRTCKNCRQNLHSWDKRPAAHVLHYSQQLRVRRNRLATFAIVKDDEVIKVDHETLEEKRLLSFRKTKTRAKANVVEFKLRDRNRNKKRANQ